MDALTKLNTWLDKPAYEAGIVLYMQHIESTGFVLTMLKTGPDDYNRQTLYQALLLKRDTLLAAQKEVEGQYPAELTQSLEEARLLMDERTILKERMRMRFNEGVTGSDEIKDWAFSILALGESLNAIYARKDFFDHHGYLPEVAHIDAYETVADLYKRVLTVRTYVTKYRKRLKSMPLDSDSFEACRRTLSAYETELHGLMQHPMLIDKFNVPVQNR